MRAVPVLVLALLAPGLCAAQSASQRLERLAAEATERGLDLFPVSEIFSRGAGPRQDRLELILSDEHRELAWPGQALGYKLGELTILELRAKAEKRLGARFDIRAFHDAILEEGHLPLSMLRLRMDAWIDAQDKRRGL